MKRTRNQKIANRARIGERIHRPKKPLEAPESLMEPDWAVPCMVCSAVPTMPLTGMCGPCTTGEADTVGGNW